MKSGDQKQVNVLAQIKEDIEKSLNLFIEKFALKNIKEKSEKKGSDYTLIDKVKDTIEFYKEINQAYKKVDTFVKGHTRFHFVGKIDNHSSAEEVDLKVS